MIYYRKNTDPEMPLPEDFDILFFGESGGRRKSKKTIKLIAVIPPCVQLWQVRFLLSVTMRKSRKCELWKDCL